jgi:hypothetical protein
MKHYNCKRTQRWSGPYWMANGEVWYFVARRNGTIRRRKATFSCIGDA